MGLKFFMLDSRRVSVGARGTKPQTHVFWLGPVAPHVLGSDSKTHLNTPKAVTYHEQSHCYRCMIGHSLGRMESRCCAILMCTVGLTGLSWKRST